jgi:hypothetical protein
MSFRQPNGRMREAIRAEAPTSLLEVRDFLAAASSAAIHFSWYAGVAKLVDARDLSNLSAPGETRGAELPKFGETGHRQSRAKRSGRPAGAKV